MSVAIIEASRVSSTPNLLHISLCNYSTEIRYTGKGVCRLVGHGNRLRGYDVLELINSKHYFKLAESNVWNVSKQCLLNIHFIVYCVVIEQNFLSLEKRISIPFRFDDK